MDCITETFESRATKDTIVLLGDSILKNNIYVRKGVDRLLDETSECDVVSLAQDGATIGTTFKQIEEISNDLNRPTTMCVLSAGGNNIIEDYINGSHSIDDMEYLAKLFGSYKKLVLTLREKMNNAAIFLIDIYYPTDDSYKEYYPLIRKWNKLQRELSSDVIKISESLTQPRDFSFAIEPSDIGGKKIVDLIVSAMK